MAAEIITNVLLIIAVTSLLGYFTSAALRSKSKINAATGERTFSYVRPFKALAVISLVLPIFMGFLTFQLSKSDQPDFIIWLVISLIFAAMSGYLLLECFFARVVISEESITSISPWSGQRTFKWAEIHSISYSKTSKWYIIRNCDGKKIRASDYLAGISELAVELKRRVPSENWVNTNESVSIGGGRI